MKILVVGAGGKSGQLVVERALAAGHSVTALVHDAASYKAPAGVQVVTGDATDAATVEKAVAGQQAVIDAIGGKTPYLATDLEQHTAKAIIDAMHRHGVRRLIAISVLGVGDSKEQAGFFYEHLLMPTFLRGAVPDKEAMEAEVKASGLDFVLVRPPFLTDSPATGQAHVVTDEDKAHKITRADLAQFMVDQLQSDTYLGQAVTVTNS
ncbi:NAD(P)-dependent oxidoreductase [Hymenobacter cheonanensis]|uniref:NAD(P)-dependent oxidoreductase n=1 Tax=Hymenobacter sp. CA2-7 TaxID=3063993 RepID=UPI002713F564|nr:SDR family oxidoreductase [Hymenobacter sp. CA2-7]MDO7887488.1 SDR family oxidoreductase [Hymenobacter sp. CA2-7]